MNAYGEPRTAEETKEAGHRGGVWVMSEVLAELLPRYAPHPSCGAEPAAFPRLIAGWRLSEAELVSSL
jgi:hypothetical protein